MPAYLIGTIHITDTARWQQYVDRVNATFPPHGARVLFRGGKGAELSGQAHGEQIVVAEFLDMAALMQWHGSNEYQQLIAMRDAGADVVLTAYET